MKSFSKLALLSSAILGSSSLMALEMPSMPDLNGFYYHAEYSVMSLDVSNQDGSGAASTPAVGLEIGKLVYNHDMADVFLEAVAILGLGQSSAFTYNGGSARYSAGINRIVGVQAKAYRQLVSKMAGFVNLGLMNVSANIASESCFLSTCVSNSPEINIGDTGISFGLGGEYQLGAASALTLSYSRFPGGNEGGSNVDISSLNLGYKARF